MVVSRNQQCCFGTDYPAGLSRALSGWRNMHMSRLLLFGVCGLLVACSSARVVMAAGGDSPASPPASIESEFGGTRPPTDLSYQGDRRHPLDPKFERCIPPFKVADQDDDFRRNAEYLSNPDLCIALEQFEEGGRPWTLEVIRNRKRPSGPLWAVPHNNEHAAFDSAVYGVTKYGGTVVAVETGGHRYNYGQDPNRNFGLGPCPLQHAPAPVYTWAFMSHHDSRYPIIALHTNSGYEGRSPISISAPGPGDHPFPGLHPTGRLAGEHTLVYVASILGPRQDPEHYSMVKLLNGAGINVMYEQVTPARNDCSMSNYAALNGIRNYFNVEVEHGDSTTQKLMIDIIMRLTVHH